MKKTMKKTMLMSLLFAFTLAMGCSGGGKEDKKAENKVQEETKEQKDKNEEGKTDVIQNSENYMTIPGTELSGCFKWAKVGDEDITLDPETAELIKEVTTIDIDMFVPVEETAEEMHVAVYVNDRYKPSDYPEAEKIGNYYFDNIIDRNYRHYIIINGTNNYTMMVHVVRNTASIEDFDVFADYFREQLRGEVEEMAINQ